MRFDARHHRACVLVALLAAATAAHAQHEDSWNPGDAPGVAAFDAEAARARAAAQAARAKARAARARADAAAREAREAAADDARRPAQPAKKKAARRDADGAVPRTLVDAVHDRAASALRPGTSGAVDQPAAAAPFDGAGRAAPSAQWPPVGTVVDSSSRAALGELVGPGLGWVLSHGVRFEIGPRRSLRMPPAFEAATERYSAQVSLSADSTHLVGHVAGLPFPDVSPADPQAGAKLMFNFDSAIAHDDAAIRGLECRTGSIGRGSESPRVERTFVVGQFQRLYFRERVTVPPLPEMPNPDQVRYKEALYPLVEPFDLAGVSSTANRYLDPGRQDDSWLYIPRMRRLRRLSSSQRSDAMFGQDTDPDSYAGYAGNVAWVTWRLLGRKTVLAPMDVESMPVTWQDGAGGFMHRGRWEPREAWVVEGESRLPGYAYSRRVIYLDTESWHILSSEMYDRSGELWKAWFNSYLYSNRPGPDARHGFDHEKLFFPSATMVDIQASHATWCALPGTRMPGDKGWSIDVGPDEGNVADAYALSTILSAGR